MSDYNSLEHDRDSKAINLIYILYFIGFATGVSAVAGVVIAHTKAGQVGDVWQSHLDYQIRTFWYGLAMVVIGTILAMFL